MLVIYIYGYVRDKIRDRRDKNKVSDTSSIYDSFLNLVSDAFDLL